MSLKFKRFMSIVLIFALILASSAPVFASGGNDFSRTSMDDVNVVLEILNELPLQERRLLQNMIDEPEFTNLYELSVADQRLVNEVTKNPESYLVAAEVVFGEVILIYETSDPNVMIAITNGHVDVVEQIAEYTFLINGEKFVFEVTIEDEYTEFYSFGGISPLGCCCSIWPWEPPMQWWHSTRPPTGIVYSWTFVRSQNRNLTSPNFFSDMVTATLAVIVVKLLWNGQFANTAGTIIAGALINAAVTTREAVLNIRFYNHATRPHTNRREVIRSYTVVNRQNQHSGTTWHYFSLH